MEKTIAPVERKEPRHHSPNIRSHRKVAVTPDVFAARGIERRYNAEKYPNREEVNWTEPKEDGDQRMHPEGRDSHDTDGQHPGPAQRPMGRCALGTSELNAARTQNPT